MSFPSSFFLGESSRRRRGWCWKDFFWAVLCYEVGRVKLIYFFPPLRLATCQQLGGDFEVRGHMGKDLNWALSRFSLLLWIK